MYKMYGILKARKGSKQKSRNLLTIDCPSQVIKMVIE